MVLPRFSLRWIFLATTVFAVVSLVAAQAVAGRQWAIALIAVLSAAVVLFSMQAAAFGLSSIVRFLRGQDFSSPGESPFAAATPVKQVVEPPADPDL